MRLGGTPGPNKKTITTNFIPGAQYYISMFLLRLLDEVGISYERRMLHTSEVHTVAPRLAQCSKKTLEEWQ